MLGFPTRFFEHSPLRQPTLVAVRGVGTGFPIERHRGIDLQHGRVGGVDGALEGHGVAPNAIGQRATGRQAGEQAVEILLPMHQRGATEVVKRVGWTPLATHRQQEGNEQRDDGYHRRVADGEDAQVPVINPPLPIPALPGTN